jgi:hypothetical protein
MILYYPKFMQFTCYLTLKMSLLMLDKFVNKIWAVSFSQLAKCQVKRTQSLKWQFFYIYKIFSCYFIYFIICKGTMISMNVCNLYLTINIFLFIS